MQTRKLKGLILNLKPKGEFDRVIRIFSSELGLVRIIAKGVRKIFSRRSFHLDLFNFVEMEVEECGNGSSCLRYLREIGSIELFSELKRSPRDFAAACVVASFLERTLPDLAPQKKLFELTKKTFESLSSKNCDSKKILLTYFLKATRLLGYLPDKMPKEHMRVKLNKILTDLDPQFNLNARRTLGIFSIFPSTRSN